MPQSDLRISILGTSFSISANEESSYLEELLRYFRQAIDNTQKATSLEDPLKIAILTGFLLCDELKKIQKQELQLLESREAEALLLDMIRRMDLVLEKQG
jgi:cell division protein ZapA (FtsZ GTPase activity inhibitor)